MTARSVAVLLRRCHNAKLPPTLRPLGVSDRVELNPVTQLWRRKAGPLEITLVKKDVARTVIGRDKAVTGFGVKPLDSSNHSLSLSRWLLVVMSWLSAWVRFAGSSS